MVITISPLIEWDIGRKENKIRNNLIEDRFISINQ
jgi:hypothetical protein